MSKGFYPVDHGDLLLPIFGGPKRSFTKWEAYCWLLDHVAFESRRANFREQPVDLTRGQIATSLGELSKKWGWEKYATQRFLKALEKARMISVAATVSATGIATGMSVITVCKYSVNKTLPDEDATAGATGSATKSETPPYKQSLNKKKKESLPSGESRQQRQSDLLSAEVITMPADDVQRAIDAYETVGRELGLKLPRGGVSAERRSAIRRCLKAKGGLPGWAAALRKLSEAKWITSGGWRGFSIDDFANPDKFERLMAGDFDIVYGQKSETTWERERREYLETGGQNSLYRGMKGDGT